MFVAILATLFIGCSSKSTELDNPKVNLSKQLKIDNIEFYLMEYHKPKIVYHTKNELETLFKDDLYKN